MCGGQAWDICTAQPPTSRAAVSRPLITARPPKTSPLQTSACTAGCRAPVALHPAATSPAPSTSFCTSSRGVGHQHRDIAQPRCTKVVSAPTSEGGGEAGRGVRRDHERVGRISEEDAHQSKSQLLLAEVDHHLTHILLLELLLPLLVPGQIVCWAHQVACNQLSMNCP